MRTYRTTLATLLLLMPLLMLLWPAAATAQNPKKADCPPAPGAVSVADVTVNGSGTCNLNGTTVNGSVKVDGGANLIANGATILGAIEVKSGSDVTLKNGTAVSGAVTLDDSGDLTVESGSTVANISMKDSGDVTIETSASAGELLVFNSGDVELRGSVAAIKALESGGIMINGARVFPAGVSMSFASGSLVICGSEIGINTDTMTDGSGGVTVTESGTSGAPVDVLAVAGVGCGPSQIEGSVIVAKGTGDVHLVGAQSESLAGDLTVTEQTGDVKTVDTFLSDLKVDKLDGSVEMTNVTTDSDTSVVSITGAAKIGSSRIGGDVEIKSAGNVTLKSVDGGDTVITDNGNVDVKSSELRGDLKIDSNADVTVMGNDFFLEDISISKNGSVTVADNVNLSLSIVENGGMVMVTDNIFTDAEVSKNTGGVTINDNTGEKLNCSDNDPAPTGLGSNTIIELADGQCAGF